MMSKILENQSQLPAAFSMRKLANNLIYYCAIQLWFVLFSWAYFYFLNV